MGYHHLIGGSQHLLVGCGCGGCSGRRVMLRLVSVRMMAAAALVRLVVRRGGLVTV